MAMSNSFFKRSLAAAIALASVSIAAANANAGNLVNYSADSWAGKSTSAGSFGAGYGADFTVDYTNGALVGEASGNASIQLFGTKVSIVDLSATANINDSSSDGANLDAEFVGATIYSKSFSDGFTFDASTDLSNYDSLFCTEFFDVTEQFTVVVVPVTVSAGATGCANLTFSATPQYVTSTHEGKLNMTVTPELSTELTVSVGVGSKVFSAGVEANVTLLDFSLPVTLNPVYNFNSQTFYYGSTGQIDLSMLDGSLDLYAKVDLGLWKKKYKYTLFDWEGVSKSWYLWNNNKPSAMGVSATTSGAAASGSYTFADTSGTLECGSTLTWYRNSTASDTGRSQIQTTTSVLGKYYTLTESDQDQYLEFCVTPKNLSGTSGDTQCSDWMSVGKLFILYSDISYGGDTLAFPYQKNDSGTCINLNDYGTGLSSFNDVLSSYKAYAPADSSATFIFFNNSSCSTSSSSDYVRKAVSANSSDLETSYTALGSSWNDVVSSVMVVYNESVSASDASVSISGNTASASYTFEVSDGAISTDESGSSYKWYRASSISGTGSTLVSSGSSKTYTLTPDDDQKYLKVCVTPSNGYTVGSEVCSGWMPVGHLIKMYDPTGNTGSSIAIAWEKSTSQTCFNMTDYSFNDKLSSYNWTNNNMANSTVTFYKDIDCSGSSTTRMVSASATETVNSMAGAIGGLWNNSVSSFKISWTSPIVISTPSVTISGNTATESHTFGGGNGYSESATYTWYRASDSSGTSSEEVDNFNSNTYTLSSDDDRKYLKACVLSGNGYVVDESTVCSSWTYVGPLVTLYADTNEGGTSLSIAYTKSTSGTCFDLTDYDFNDLTSSLTLTSTGSGSTLYTYQHIGCNDTGVQSHYAAGGSSLSTNYSGQTNDTRSSIKVVY